MKLRPKKLIELYDERAPDEGRGSDVSAISGLLGEDLVFGLFLHYWRHVEKGTAKILSYSCTGGKVKGPRLDGWLLCTGQRSELLYQTEVKNWAAYSWGEEPLSLRATPNEVAKYGKEQWDYYFGGSGIPHERVSKVLLPMKKPEGYAHIHATPLCCFWFYIVKNAEQPFTKHRFPNGQVVHVFSASAYLRSIGDSDIEIEMPRFERRLRLIKSLQRES